MQEAVREATPSSFVTVVAWIYIAFGGLATFISLMQNIIINTVFPFDQMHDAQVRSGVAMPALFDAIFHHIRLIIFLFFLASLTTFLTAIGLLNRKSWARLVFIGILVLSIAWNVAGLVLQQVMVSSMPTMNVPNAPADFDTAMQGMMIGIRVFSAIFAIGFSVLFGWMIKRLISPAIAAEFR